MAWMFLVPVLLWLFLTFGFYTLLQAPADTLTAWASERLAIPVDAEAAGWWNNVKEFLNGARGALVGIVLKLATLYVLYIANKYIVLILLSPLLAYASERTEQVLTGRDLPFSWVQLLKDALRGALVALRNGAIEINITLVIWAVTLFIPVITPISIVLLFLVSAYFYGFSMFDHVYERRRMRIGESVRAIQGNLGAVLANGALFGLFMKIPLIGMMFAPMMATIGAVIATVEKERGSTAP